MGALRELLALGLADAQPTPYSAFTVRSKVIEHAYFCEAIRQVAMIHHRGIEAGVAEGLLLVAQTGAGKTTVLEHYRSRFPRRTVNGTTRIPVLLVTTPDTPSVKNLAEAILGALGDPAAEKGTAQAKTRRIIHFLKACHVELLMIDEFQHFYDGRGISESRRVTDWLKNLFNLSNIPVVLSGLPRSIAVVNRNPQLRRRFSSPYYLRPFDFETSEDQGMFRAILKKMHGLLPVPCPALHEMNLARRFYYATMGLMDYVAKILDKAVLLCQAVGRREITMSGLAQAFREAVWRDAPDSLNPFATNKEMRQLTKVGEPFDVWDDPARYTSANQPKRKTAGGMKNGQ